MDGEGRCGRWGTFHSASIGNSSPRLMEPSPSVSQCESTKSTSAADVSGGRRHGGHSWSVRGIEYGVGAWARRGGEGRRG